MRDYEMKPRVPMMMLDLITNTHLKKKKKKTTFLIMDNNVLKSRDGKCLRNYPCHLYP